MPRALTTGATHALAVLIDLDEGAGSDRFRRHHLDRDRRRRTDVAFRRSRILGGREWVRLGAVELGLDCLRRYLQGLPVVERIDFERPDQPSGRLRFLIPSPHPAANEPLHSSTGENQAPVEAIRGRFQCLTAVLLKRRPPVGCSS